ncbi:phosphoenolpyruvate synthase [Echinicola sp. CAU 1574]|uniref:Phosphoenolpyruvate synthase n=1 Tax=Echinicola arenosa TaxID=2774144 RepID=A0ABR9AL20_9BACT|nr:phosphoenolpyruvate synthase [Echinicola arenosa]MBD8489496.1 phosphoenolpyruvate synthase [Echinicola arenosa]
MKPLIDSSLIKLLSSVGIEDIQKVGGKNASLGEMLKNLTQKGVKVPEGFIVTVDAYYQFLEEGNIREDIELILANIDVDDLISLGQKAQLIRKTISEAPMSATLQGIIEEAYFNLSATYGVGKADVAVRSSATAEDLPDASFAGQQDTYLNVRGIEDLILSIKKCFASLFTERAISYRRKRNYHDLKVGIAVCVQKMVRSDLGASGVAFSLDTESGFKDVVMINGSYGLGEMVVQGAVKPDEFLVHKPKLKAGFPAIIEKQLGTKDHQMVYSMVEGKRVEICPVGPERQRRFCLKDEHILQLAKWVCVIEEHYSMVHNRWCPMDVEWALDGQSGELFIVQSRPETIHSSKKHSDVKLFHLDEKEDSSRVLLKGIAVGDGIAAGKVFVVGEHDECHDLIHKVKKGDVLVTDMTDPDWEPVMKKVSGIITNKGGRTCHAAIVARELGVPAIVGCGNATEILTPNLTATVSCAEGEVGKVYKGHLNYREEILDLESLPKVSTPVMFNIGSPSSAFKYAQYPHCGVGLARLEFIINNYIKVHPLALLNHREINDEKLSEKIHQLTSAYDSEEDYFIEKLSFGISKIAAAFYPQPVVVRFSDFKSNEYFNLLGGNYFEPVEENPMIGWRGASRYYSEKFKPAFNLECQAIKKVREEMGLDNVILMIPFCRTVEELVKVKAVMKKQGLEQKKNNLKVYMMAEVPSNIILADEFAKHIDGFSIGSNDLTQLTLGIDRDSSLVAHLYDEKHSAVKTMIRMLIAAAKRNNVKVGLCGQGASDFPEFTDFLVKEGIDTISITPDAISKTIQAVYQAEIRKAI